MRGNFTFGQVFSNDIHSSVNYADEVYSAMQRQRQRKRNTPTAPRARKRLGAPPPPPARVADRLRVPVAPAPAPRNPDPDLTFTYVIVVNRSSVVSAIVELLSGDRAREQILKKGFTFWVSHARDGGKFAIVCMKRMDAARLHKLDQVTTKLVFLMVIPRSTAVQEAASIPPICTVLTEPNALLVFLHLDRVTTSEAHAFWKVVDPSHHIPEAHRIVHPTPSASDSFDDDDEEEDEVDNDVEVVWNANNDNIGLEDPYDQEEADLLRAVAESLNTEQPRAPTVAPVDPLPPGFQMVRVNPPPAPPPSPMRTYAAPRRQIPERVPTNAVKRPHHLRAGRSREAVQMMNTAAQELREERQQRQISNTVSVMKTDDRVKHVTKAPAAEDRNVPAMTILREHNTCMICAESHITSMVLPCAHLLFCRDCVETWKAKANNCPQCRGAIQMIVDPKGAVDFRSEHTSRTKTTEGVRKFREALSQELAETIGSEQGEKRPRDGEDEEPDVIDLTKVSALPLEKRTKQDE
jgi:hypothetical protein